MNFLIMADYYSNYFEITKLSNTKANTVIEATKEQFAHHDFVDTMISDNGPQFDNQEFRDFSEEWEFEHITSSPYHAKSNGLIEAGVLVAKRILEKSYKSGKDHYKALLTHRNTPTDDYLGSPSQRMFGRRTKNSLPMAKALLQPKVIDPKKVLDRKKQEQM